jgi:peptide/nickel transport system permease protein
VSAHWFPIQGAYAAELMPSSNFIYYWSLFRHWQLPFLATSLVMIGGQAIGMRSMSLYELNADYVLYAKLLGIRESKITAYVFKNSVLPQITGLALSLGTMVSGALITEIVFSYPGIGSQLLSAIKNVDYMLISGCTLLISMTVLLANFLIEIIYGLIDPRVRAAQAEDS